MTLETLILDELNQMNLNGITVLSVAYEIGLMRVVFELSKAEIEFTIDDDYQFQVTSITYNGKIYEDPRYLVKFEELAFDVMTKVKLTEMKNRAKHKHLRPRLEKNEAVVRSALEQARYDAVLIREEKNKEQEAQLSLKEQEIKKLEQALYEKENALALQRKNEEMALVAKQIENRERIEKTVKRKVTRLFETFKKSKEE